MSDTEYKRRPIEITRGDFKMRLNTTPVSGWDARSDLRALASLSKLAFDFHSRGKPVLLHTTTHAAYPAMPWTVN